MRLVKNTLLSVYMVLYESQCDFQDTFHDTSTYTHMHTGMHVMVHVLFLSQLQLQCVHVHTTHHIGLLPACHARN